MRSFIRTIRSLLARRRFERDMREELAAHIEHRADDLVARGLSRQAAWRQARLEFGAIEAYKEQCRDAAALVPGRVLHGVAGDFKLAARRLLAAPVFTIFATLSLAGGVAITTAAYSVVDSVFWCDSGIPEPDTAVVLMSSWRVGNDPRWMASIAEFEALEGAQSSFASLSASHVFYPAVETPQVTDIQPAEGVDGRYFAVMAVQPRLGRFIQEADTSSAAAPVVVLSHRLWRSQFGEDAGIIGRTVRISGQPFEVIGVAPRGFQGVLPDPRGTRLWVSLHHSEVLRFTQTTGLVSSRDRRHLTLVARLLPGGDVSSAADQVSAIGVALDTRHPRASSASSGPVDRRWSLATMNDLRTGGDMLRRLGLIILGLVGLVLVVACTNLASLVLARATARSHEVAVRRALGASRLRLVRELLAESAILATVGGVIAYPVLLLLQSALHFDIPIGRDWVVSVHPEISGTALFVAITAVVMSIGVFGLEPALKLTRPADARENLTGTAGTVGVLRLSRQRRLLRWQVAVSTGFFIIASLCVRYLVTEARHDSGIELERLSVADVNFTSQRWDEPRARAALARILDTMLTQPGIEAAAISSGLPFGTAWTPRALISHISQSHQPQEPERALTVMGTPGLFRTTGIRIVGGRQFDDRDVAGARPVMVVSESTARRMFGTTDVVGRELLFTVDTESRGRGENRPARLVQIVGVAEDTDTTHFYRRQGGSVVYLPFAQEYWPTVTIVGRAEDGGVAAGALRTAARIAAPELGLDQIGTGYTVLAGPHLFLRMTGLLALALGLVTLLLAMAGLFGVQLHTVSQRTREIGVRMSFGASGGQIRAMVLKDGYRPVLQGLAMGLFIGIVGRALIQSQTPVPIGVVDRWMLLLVPVPLLLAAFFACWLPAYRASRVDPNVALRHL